MRLRSLRPSAGGAVLLLALASLGLAGFVRSQVDSPTGQGPCLFWATREPHFVVNERGSIHLTGDAQFAAVAAGFAAWSGPSCTDVRLQNDGLTSRNDVAYDADAGSPAGLVVWRPVLCSAVVPATDPCLAEASCDDAYDCLDDGEAIAIAVTSSFYRIDTGQILGAGTELDDPSFVFSTVAAPPCDPSRPAACDADGGLPADAGCAGYGPPPPGPSAVNPTCVAYDVQDILTHEAGHFLGFGHTPVVGATMNAQSDLGDTSKRTLHPDDILAVCTVYPAGEPTLTTCSADAGSAAPRPGCGCSGGGAPGEAAFVALLLALGLGASRSRPRRG